MRTWATICVACISVFGVASAKEKKEVPRATVELVVRCSDGRPLANTQVDVRSGMHFFHDQDRPSANVKTDAEGRMSLPWPVGLHCLHVIVNGIGYGATGRFELLEGGTARPALPPLVPFGAIEGVVPKDSLQPGTYVEIHEMSNRARGRADCDKAGRFAFENLPAGEHGLILRPNSCRVWTMTEVNVQPGQRVRNVVIRKQEDKPLSREEAMMFGLKNLEAKTIPWAAGLVHDEAGSLLEGVDVFAVVGYYGGIRMYEAIKSAKSDKDGRWKIEGSDSLSSFSGTIIAHKEGHPYTYLPMRNPMPDGDHDRSAKPALGAYDLVLPPGAGAWRSPSGGRASPWSMLP